ncbi:MAG: UDP-2,3-diacylglucosamine diphosphatase [Calditrichaeota bacterium]|nr:UDP-2,3-diacylglucosamine diphosphatase [Calditrichota bacterium]
MKERATGVRPDEGSKTPMASDSAERVLFISDAHLGAADPEREARKEDLIRFLDSLQPARDRLVVVGDLFDFWFEYRYVVPGRYFRILARLARLVEKGMRVDYVPGNHDFWVRDFLPEKLGVQVHRPSLETRVLGQRLFVIHGDGLRRDDYGYRFLKKVLQNPINIALFRWLHPDLAFGLAHTFAELSRKQKGEPYQEVDDSDYIDFGQQKLREGFDLVVLAHTHKARLLKLEGGVFLNPGEWLEGYTFGELRGGLVSLKRWFVTGEKAGSETLATVELGEAGSGELARL